MVFTSTVLLIRMVLHRYVLRFRNDYSVSLKSTTWDRLKDNQSFKIISYLRATDLKF